MACQSVGIVTSTNQPDRNAVLDNHTLTLNFDTGTLAQIVKEKKKHQKKWNEWR